MVVGSARVTVDGSLGGVVRFSIPGIGIAGVGASQPMSALITPVRREAGINTGIAIQSAASGPVTLKLILRDKQGQQVTNGSRTIENFPAAGHLAKFINELFEQANTDNFEGTLVVEATGGRVTGTALELGSLPGQFTTLPVTPLN